MRDAELVKVMKVSQTKDERRHENGASETSSRTQKQGNTSGTEKTFFGDGSLMKSLALHGFDKRCEKEALWGSIDEGIDRGKYERNRYSEIRLFQSARTATMFLQVGQSVQRSLRGSRRSH